ncbi:hypothetical protein CBP31_11625 [Oceanisphaera profunda]|uniref:RHIM domain-containing protein n=1 Tax=Oceanisphaera profunda TaxID=1416627 RepID=A0A1Y0D6M7_9GAMM|nr:hypothetical protein [Oceanisphaera profunda]ART83180.1 hypothetical protein CBP31_11625 [Oceanisphaera profunda]
MRPLAGMKKDEIFLEVNSDERIGPFRTAFTNKSVTIYETSISVTEGDKVIRPLPNGREEFYTILETHYSSGLSAIPAHYTLKISKDSAITPPPNVGNTTNHISISNSQGFQVGNYNTQNLELVLNQLVEHINNTDASREEKEEAKGRLDSFLSHPLVSTVVGASLPVALGLFS